MKRFALIAVLVVGCSGTHYIDTGMKSDPAPNPVPGFICNRPPALPGGRVSNQSPGPYERVCDIEEVKVMWAPTHQSGRRPSRASSCASRSCSSPAGVIC